MDSTIIIIPAGEILKSFTVNIINDNIAECDETFRLALSVSTPPCEVVNGRNNITEVTIQDNDGRRSVSD